jgi:hypothetical protein
MKKAIAISSVLAVVFIYACKKKSITTYDCTGITPTYIVNIKPILDASCATSNCHSASKKASGIDLSTYAASKAYSSNDKFIKSIQHISGVESMPKGGSKLSEADIKLIYCWTNNGTPE